MKRSLFLLLVAAAACSSFGSGDDSSTTPDGGTDSPNPTPNPPPPPASDGGADAGPSLCETLAGNADLLFCADFETVSAPLYGWQAGTGPAGGFSITEAGKNGRGLQVTMNGDIPLQLTENGLYDPTATNVQLDMDIDVVQVTLEAVTLAAIALVGAPGNDEYGLGVFGQGANVSSPRNAGPVVKAGGWHHLVVKLIAGQANSDAGWSQDVTIDGVVITQTTKDSTAFNSVVLGIGVTEFAPDPAKRATAIFDNIVLKKLPR